jgi:excisionase family DNA binding protein
LYGSEEFPPGHFVFGTKKSKEGGNMSKLISLQQAAVTLSVTEGTIRRWIKSGKLKAYKLGKLWRITEDEIQNFLTIAERM